MLHVHSHNEESFLSNYLIKIVFDAEMRAFALTDLQFVLLEYARNQLLYMIFFASIKKRKQ